MNTETKGEISILSSCILFAGVAVLVKVVSAIHSAFFIASIRYVFGIIVGISLLLLLKKPIAIHGLKYWILRGMFGFLATSSFYIAIQMTSSGRATLLVNTYPAFVAIYGYTSDADGIRHAMIDDSKCDFEDAKYMLVSCSAFVNYLIMKATKAGVVF